MGPDLRHHTAVAIRGDFYEDDEPLDKILGEWDRGVKGVTAPPEHGKRGVTVNVEIKGLVPAPAPWLMGLSSSGTVSTMGR
jgi:hypothetical protein